MQQKFLQAVFLSINDFLYKKVAKGLKKPDFARCEKFFGGIFFFEMTPHKKMQQKLRTMGFTGQYPK